jgi:hypothetical protein
MCPNHADLVMPPRRTVRNGLETVEVVKTGQHNNGNVVVVPEEEPRVDIPTEDMVINNRRYRVPEQVIKLDFWNKVHLIQKEAPARSAKRAKLAERALKTATRADLDAAHLMLSLLHSEDGNKGPAAEPVIHEVLAPVPLPVRKVVSASPPATANGGAQGNGRPMRPSSTNSDSAVLPKITLRLHRPIV